jgi:hypothetical protein
VIVFIATWAEDNQGRSLTEAEITNRLLSYYFLKDLPNDWLEMYSKNGVYVSGKSEKQNLKVPKSPIPKKEPKGKKRWK